jgi:MoaA/NifB/PqqE/SkfB family radical SAM enzyme
MTRLDDFGFHGISLERANRLSCGSSDKLTYCEHVVTAKCNFSCSYCNCLCSDDDQSLEGICRIIDKVASLGCRYYHITGGEPMTRQDIIDIVSYAAWRIPVVRMSTNGSADLDLYEKIVQAGCRSFAISLDTAVESERQQDFDNVVRCIRFLASCRSDIQIGTVFDEKNMSEASKIVRFISELGVSDIKVGTASQNDVSKVDLSGVEDLFGKHRILRYRASRFANGRGMRGLEASDCNRCFLSLDDVTIKGTKHYPCAVYLREGGAAIGEVDDSMMESRRAWFQEHNSSKDSLCCDFCMDFKCDFNNTVGIMNQL